MTKTDRYSNGVQAVTNLARGINSEIGYYKEHYFTETGFAVKLSNGTATARFPSRGNQTKNYN